MSPLVHGPKAPTHTFPLGNDGVLKPGRVNPSPLSLSPFALETCQYVIIFHTDEFKLLALFQLRSTSRFHSPTYSFVTDRAPRVTSQPRLSQSCFFGNSTLGEISTPELSHSTGKYCVLCNTTSCALRRTRGFLKVWCRPTSLSPVSRKQQQTFPRLPTHHAETQRPLLPPPRLFPESSCRGASSGTRKGLRGVLLNTSFLWTCRVLSEQQQTSVVWHKLGGLC